jgi:hypothetical protein
MEDPPPEKTMEAWPPLLYIDPPLAETLVSLFFSNSVLTDSPNWQAIKMQITIIFFNILIK